MRIGPLCRLDELHPRLTAFAASSKWEEVRLVHHERWQTESLSGSMISCLGAMPAICHKKAATEAALDFFRLSGIDVPSHLETYRSDGEAVICARRMAASGQRLATILPQSPEIRSLDACLVAPALYDYLNDKRNISELCAASFIPARRIYTRDAARNIHAGAMDFPVFLKGAVEGASGGGLDVRHCSNDEEFREALSWFESIPAFKALIIEAAIPFTTSWCLNFAVLDREVRYLGAAEQLFAREGVQCGSLIDPENAPPPLAVDIGEEICAAAQDRGYRGISALDMCINAEGRIYFFDLNFRLASSTCFILLHAGMHGLDQVGVMSGFNIPGNLPDLLSRLTDLAQRRLFVPVHLYDGGEHEGKFAPNRIVGFFRGKSRREVNALVKEVKGRLAS
jgi:hypothetical protein